MKKYLLIATCLTAVITGTAWSVSACLCVLSPPGVSLRSQVRAARSSATSIFVGKVISIRYSEEKINDTPAKLFAKFAVERSWKGSEADYIEVETANICCICGYTFEVGKTYIVYSNSAATTVPVVSSCSRTSPIDGKSPDEKYLGKLRKPRKS